MTDRDNAPVIAWFRQDLRLTDNPAWRAACESGRPVLPVYVLDDESAGEWRMGAASRWWLHQSLASLDGSLQGHLSLHRGRADDVIADLVRRTGASSVLWNRCYEPWRIARDKTIKQQLADDGVEAQSFNGSLLFEPHTVRTGAGGPYKVFTPFWRRGCLGSGREPGDPLSAAQPSAYAVDVRAVALDALELLPPTRWYDEMAATWSPGEEGAMRRLGAFLSEGLAGYRDGRNRPDLEHVSRLSPHLHFGEVSPRQVWHAARHAMAAAGLEQDGDVFLSEIGWREFSNNLLYHWPHLPATPLQPRFAAFDWREDTGQLDAWRHGRTGYPIIDAGMRQLWRTGYMHNRVRMLVGSFLVKNLRLHWHHGERWFWDTLVDADLANNSASWQWIAGCGADAAPYFRIFNPVTQGQKFDPDGDYVRRYVPELGQLPKNCIHDPWNAPANVLAQAGIRLGTDYPEPIVDLKASRQAALDAFAATKTAA